METTVYIYDYKDVDLLVNASKDAACMSMIESLPVLKRSVAFLDRLSEAEWEPFRSFVVLCNLIAIGGQARLELLACEEDVFDAVIISRRFTLERSDYEGFTRLFEQAQSISVEPLGEDRVAIRAKYSFR